MEENENEQSLENQEIWAKVFFNGYFLSLKDHSLAVDIRIPNPNKEEAFWGTTKVFCPIDANEKGEVDLTPLLHSLLLAIKENPESDVRAYANGFMRQFHLNKDLLQMPIPQTLLDLFSGRNQT